MSDDEIDQIRDDIRRLRSKSDDDIDLSDSPEITPEQWAQSKPNPFYRPVKEQVTLRLDRDVLNWFKLTQEKYQTAINEALREHMYRQRETS